MRLTQEKVFALVSEGGSAGGGVDCGLLVFIFHSTSVLPRSGRLAQGPCTAADKRLQ